MCGRYGFGNPARLAELPLEALLPELTPRYNVAPGQEVPIVLTDREGARQATMARWGLVPIWARSPDMGNRLINARSESVREKPSFRDAFRKRRAVMPADLFYEWQRVEGEKKRLPWCIRRPGEAPFAFAALWERWRPHESPAGTQWLITCTILTTAPNRVMEPIHDRMPVILGNDSIATWLDPDSGEEDLIRLMVPYSGVLEAWRVGLRVNSPANDDPACSRALTS